MPIETNQMITYQKFSVMTCDQVRKYWNKATNREKCLDMWAAISENKDGTTEEDFLDFMNFYDVDVEEETKGYSCYACVECGPDCADCPITWSEKHGDCFHAKSSYKIWLKSKTVKNAKTILKIIKTTWKK